uniref:2'-deoxynucleoside 5'-phosphate N-hydrolase 1 n=1 Tax=Neogobius melanostomus TaxID=47308 RepID=A0A8C6TEI8_9GOBI
MSRCRHHAARFWRVSARAPGRSTAPPVCSARPGEMHIYFCGSIRGGRDDVHVYRRIVHELRTYGTVLTEHVSDERLTDTGEKTEAGDKEIHDRDVDWLRQSHVVVAEVTQPSLGVGYELGRAVDMNKQVLCLFRPESGRLSAMIRGAEDGRRFVVQDYSEEQVQTVLKRFFKDFCGSSSSPTTPKKMSE